MLTLTCNLKTICEPITFFQGGQHDQLRRNNICFRLSCHFVFVLALYLVFGFNARAKRGVFYFVFTGRVYSRPDVLCF